MRKVLLATTALVAMNVTAAQADITISGFQNFEVSNTGGDATWYQDGAVNISSTVTTDSGLTLTALHSINTSATGTPADDTAASIDTDAHVDDSYINIGGEFGNIRLGDTDDALDRFDGSVPSNWTENSGGHAIGGDKMMASFIAPSISGATVYASSTANGDYTGMGINYSNGPVTVMYQTATNGTTDSSLMAVNLSMAGVTVGMSTMDNDAAGTKTEATSTGVMYDVNDAMGVYYVTEKDSKTAKSQSSIGATYAIAPGLSTFVESFDNGTGTTTTYAELKVTF
jgi:hypothetical protein